MSGESLLKGLESGYIDSSISASESFKPQLITNDPEKREKVITALKQEMESCDEFMFSVAFVNSGGVNALAQEFRELDRRGVKGRIIASQYQSFTEPAALRALLKNRGIDVRIMTEDACKMHSKCYIFRHGDIFDVLIGSSNLTNSALCENMEWNLKINSMDSGEIIKSLISEFEKAFSIATVVDEAWIEQYSRVYDDMRQLRKSLPEKDRRLPGGTGRPQPNRMQQEALESLQKLRDKGADRALVISATGSGKTYLSAFDARATGMKMLYIVHRLPILRKSMKSFEAVMEGTESVAMYDPARNNLYADCTFATIQTLSKPRVLSMIPPDTFDYILIDEVHHAGAETYQRVIGHFKPKFLLGMTATPDRTDDYDIYRLFDYNIACEIRLREAMENRLICPFHYFGISDLSIDGESDEDYSHFLKTHIDQRVDNVISNADYYGFCGKRVKGLVFCTDLEDAEEYSRRFNARGYRTTWVSGAMDKGLVESQIERLESDEEELALDYIFTADLFNEGVDIPAINQVIMLRPTQSPIVFTQQLGRGLRHHPDKDYVVVLDFIGNYERNYSIPMALSDDRSYSKTETRRAVSTGDSIIPGNSTISFDEVARKRIYDSIDRTDFTEARIISESYKALKMKLGRIPRLMDFRTHGTYEPLNILSKYGSYHGFLAKKEKEYSAVLTERQEAFLKRIVKFTAAGKRRDEFTAVRLLLDGTGDLVSGLAAAGIDAEEGNILQVLDGSFYGSASSDSQEEDEDAGNDDIRLIEQDGPVWRATHELASMLEDPCFRDHVEQVVELAEDGWSSSYSSNAGTGGPVLNMRYTYEEACRVMGWKRNVTAQNIGGYFHHKETNTFPVFINYHKGEDVVESQRYEDHFVNRGTLIALSKSREGPESSRMRTVRDSDANGAKILLFVRKSKNDKGSKEFYYLGRMRFSRFLDSNTPVTIEYRLDDEVRSDLYDYFETEI